MLLVPWAIGCGIARRLAWQDLLLLVAMLLFFLAHNQLLTWLRLRLVAASDPEAVGRARGIFLLLAGAGGGAILPLLALYRLTALLALGLIAGVLVAASMHLVYRRLDHGLAGQVLAPAGLALSAPAAYYVARGALDRTSVALWALNFLFFLGAVLYVRLKIDALKRTASLIAPAAKLRFAAQTLGIDLAILRRAARPSGQIEARRHPRHGALDRVRPPRHLARVRRSCPWSRSPSSWSSRPESPPCPADPCATATPTASTASSRSSPFWP